MSNKQTESVAALKAIYPNVTLVGSMRKEDGKTIDPLVFWSPILRVVASIFSNRRILPEVVLNPSPLPNAGADYFGEGALQFYAGIPQFLIHLGETTKYLLSVCGPGKEISIDFIKSAEFPASCQRELDKLSNQFLASESSRWIQFHVPGTSFTNDEIYDFLLYIVVLHEIGHLENKYFDNWDRLMKKTRGYLHDFLSNSNWLRNGYWPSDDIIENWCKEAVADQLALSILWDNWMSGEEHSLINLSFGIIYGVFELFEHLSPPQEYLSHPPARMRRDLLHFIRAKEYNMDEITYYTQQNGSGLICGSLFDSYINRKFG